MLGLENDLPEDEQFQRVKLVDFTGTALKDGAKLLLQSLATDLTCLHDYEKLATALGTPEVSVHNAARWSTDVEFGRQMLNGVNPVVIKRCTKLPANFLVTHDMVKGSLNRGKSLDEEMEVCISPHHTHNILDRLHLMMYVHVQQYSNNSSIDMSIDLYLLEHNEFINFML